LFEKRSTFLPLAALAINWCWLVAREATIIERMIVRARIVGLACIMFLLLREQYHESVCN